MKQSTLKMVLYAIIALALVVSVAPFLIPNPVEEVNILSTLFDAVLLGMGVYIAFLLIKIIEASAGSVLARSLTSVFIGIIFLGFSHNFETVLFLFGMETELNETIHRLFITAAILPMLIGFRIAYKEFKS